MSFAIWSFPDPKIVINIPHYYPKASIRLTHYSQCNKKIIENKPQRDYSSGHDPADILPRV